MCVNQSKSYISTTIKMSLLESKKCAYEYLIEEAIFPYPWRQHTGLHLVLGHGCHVVADQPSATWQSTWTPFFEQPAAGRSGIRDSKPQSRFTQQERTGPRHPMRCKTGLGPGSCSGRGLDSHILCTYSKTGLGPGL